MVEKKGVGCYQQEITSQTFRTVPSIMINLSQKKLSYPRKLQQVRLIHKKLHKFLTQNLEKVGGVWDNHRTRKTTQNNKKTRKSRF